MPCEISKDDSKIQAKVMAKIKSYSSTMAKQNSWLQMADWKKPADNWYDQVEDGAMIEIKTLHVSKPTTISWCVSRACQRQESRC